MKTPLKLLICAAAAFAVAGNYSCSKDDDKDSSPYEFEYGGHTYLVIKEKRTWLEAAGNAASRGGYLVEIDSQGEQDAVYNGIKAAGISSSYTQVKDGGGVAYVWIGATDRTQEGSWIWNGAYQSGTFPVFWLGSNTGIAVGGSFVNWGGKSGGRFNEPDNFTDPGLSPNGQNAAAIGLASWPSGSSSPLGQAGEWNDIAETNKLYYVVELD